MDCWLRLLQFNGHIDYHIFHDGVSERSHSRVWQLYLNLLGATSWLSGLENLIRLRLRQSCALVLFGHVEGHL